MNIRKSIILRVRLVFLLMLGIAMAALGKIVYVQQVEGGKWTKLAEEIGLRYRPVPATRGNIYSDNGSLLATSVPHYKLAMDPSVSDAELYRAGIDSLSLLLSKFFKDKSQLQYKQLINDARLAGRQYVILNNNLVKYPDKKVMATWPLFREGRNKGGVIFEKIDRRFRPFSYLGYRTIGFLNENNQGAGLEYSFNNHLAGKDGSALFQRISGGKWKPVYDGTEVKPIDGYDISTTINVNIQDVSEAALLSALIEHDAEYGSVVVMEVKTGKIKAISNLSKGGGKGRYREVFNYAVQGLNDPGSTFKLFSMMALLDETSLKLSDTVDTGDGQYKFFSSIMRDHKPGGYGKISMKEAFEISSNIAISRKIQENFGHNPKRFIDYLENLGLNKPLGFQIMGEGLPRIKQPQDKSWSGITLPWMSIGYEVELTPLQVLAYYNAIANDGTLIRPLLVDKVKYADKVVEHYEADVLKKKICSANTLKAIRELLEGVVENGTAQNIKNANYKIAGKTGTAQRIKDGRYSRSYYTSFVGYFPADKPKYSCIVVIDDPKGFRQYGSNVAGPVFKEIADKIYSIDLQLHAPWYVLAPQDSTLPVIRAGNRDDLDLICRELKLKVEDRSTDEWVVSQAKDNNILWSTNEIIPGVVPDVAGMTLRDAMYILENQGLRVNFKGAGRVAVQSQRPGTRALKGSTIYLTLS